MLYFIFIKLVLCLTPCMRRWRKNWTSWWPKIPSGRVHVQIQPNFPPFMRRGWTVTCLLWGNHAYSMSRSGPQWTAYRTPRDHKNERPIEDVCLVTRHHKGHRKHCPQLHWVSNQSTLPIIAPLHPWIWPMRPWACMFISGLCWSISRRKWYSFSLTPILSG